jgi:hypothetical protein
MFGSHATRSINWARGFASQPPTAYNNHNFFEDTMGINVKQSIDHLTRKPMNRREFLASIGAAGLALVGITSIIKALELKGSEHQSQSGYGASAYGGRKDGA